MSLIIPPYSPFGECSVCKQDAALDDIGICFRCLFWMELDARNMDGRFDVPQTEKEVVDEIISSEEQGQFLCIRCYDEPVEHGDSYCEACWQYLKHTGQA